MSTPNPPPLLQLAFEACRECAESTHTGEIWLGGISQEYQDKGVSRHVLATLAEHGYLTQIGDTACSLGNARYVLTPDEKPTKTIEAREQLDAAPTDDPPESNWQEATWSDIGKRLLLKGVVAFGAILVEATLEGVFSRTYEDANGRKHDKKTGRFTK
jgi:hypothetical protein